ncbi:type IV pilin [Methanofollis formosanus]|uniref:Type IV pilin n=1 Tax=Methanofollis formosanus TaxID=299308 RepID=A0A8G0ZYX3_9EURY|nr:type IV pilin N-terminal domain-containing protein [Methanofollis formosanus]QYZ78664.1 type IV pilin [Methanofollis formosanus]
MKEFVKNEEAVSPVIGVILMVAITVILAAVIAAFVFGMAGNVSTTKIVAATAIQQNDDIIITYKGGADNGELSYLIMNVEDKALCYTVGDTGSTGTSAPAESEVSGCRVPVGKAWTFTGAGGDGKNHVVVTGHFKDGYEQVILDTFV